MALVPSLCWSIEVRRPPDRCGLDGLADDADGAGIHGRQAAQGEAVAEQFRRRGDVAEHRPVDGEVGRQQGVGQPRRLAGGQHRPAAAPPDAVERAGGIPQERQPPGVVAPDQDVAAPAGANRRPPEVGRTRAARDHRRQRDVPPPPVADQEMLPSDLAHPEAGARPDQDVDVLDRTERPPAPALQSGQDAVDGAPLDFAGVAPVGHQIAVLGRAGDAHRQ